MFTRRSFPILLLVGLLIAANLGAVIKVKGDEPNQLDSALTSVSLQLPFHGQKGILQGPWGDFPDDAVCGVCCSISHHVGPVHEAIDFDMEYENVYAAESGKVIFAGDHTPICCSYGNLVKIQHDNGYISYYAHLRDWDRNFVAGETRVAKGQWLGVSGMSGTDNTHLHFEVRDASNNAVWVRDIPGMHWHSGDPNNPCGVKQGAYYGYGDGPTPTCEPLKLESDVTVSDFVDASSTTLTVRARVKNPCSEPIGLAPYSLRWRLKVRYPSGQEAYWPAPACFVGFSGGQSKEVTITFLRANFGDWVCRQNGAYRVIGLEYGQCPAGGLEPPEWFQVINPDNHRSQPCFNGCCASGASAVQGAQLQGCPNYCGGQPGWTPTPTPRQVYTPTPTPQPPPGPWGIVLYEDNNCGGLYDQFQSNGCHNLINARLADSFTANFASPKHIHFYEGADCNTAARQDEWKGTTMNGCQPLPDNIKGWVGSIHIADYVPGTPTPTRRFPSTATLVCPTNTPRATNTPTRGPYPPPRTATPRPTATNTPRPTNTPAASITIGPLQKGFGGFVYRVGTQEGVAGVHLALTYWNQDQARWVGGGSDDTDTAGRYLLRTTQAAAKFRVVVFAPEGMSYHDVVIRHPYAKRVDERTIEWNLPSASTLGFFESDFLLAGQPPTSTPTATRTPRPTKTPGATPTVTPAPTATQPPQSCSPIVILDWPGEGANLRSPVFFNGWAIDAASQSGSGVTQIYLLLGYPSDRKVWWEVAISERPDIAKGWGEKFRMSGYWGLVPLEEVGQYAATVWANTSCGWVWSATKYFTVTELPIPIHHHVDHPVAERTYSSPFNFSGWTVKQSGQAVAKVEFYLDLLPGQVGKYGEAACDEYRADLPERYRNSGWHFFFDPAWVNPGRHRLYVFAVDADGRWLGVIARDFFVSRSGE